MESKKLKEREKQIHRGIRQESFTGINREH
jgi:hypothetical protein